MGNADFLAQAWKRQFDVGLGLLERMLEGATRVNKALSAKDTAQVLELQAQQARASAAKSLACWRTLCEAALQCSRRNGPLHGADKGRHEMTVKQVLFGETAHARLLKGMNTLADAVCVMLGPKARTMVLEKSWCAHRDQR